MRSAKNLILKSTAVLVLMVGLVSACALDSVSWMPTFICFGCFTYLAVFAYANNFFEGGEEDDMD